MDAKLIRAYISTRNEYERAISGFKIVVLFRFGKLTRLLKELENIYRLAIIDIVNNQSITDISEIVHTLNSNGILRFNRYFDFPWKESHVRKRIRKLIVNQELPGYKIDNKNKRIYK